MFRRWLFYYIPESSRGATIGRGWRASRAAGAPEPRLPSITRAWLRHSAPRRGADVVGLRATPAACAVALLVLSVGVTGCGESPAAPDAAGDASSVRCTSDADCDDHRFCSGVEHCMPSSANADARGCVATPVCAAPLVCDEAMSSCVRPTCDAPDADRDGHDAVECGGDDCDDGDALRSPGRTEVCDVSHDEDCDPSTVGTVDADGDGYVSAACCNAGVSGSPTCGDDCNDAIAGTHPSANEVCNGTDDDCDLTIDEGTTVTVYADSDQDGYGAGTGVLGCAGAAGTAPLPGDCNDSRVGTHPGATDVCNGADDDCDVAVDEMATCAAIPNGVSGCSAGLCVPASCNAGFHVCGAACVTDDDPATCGRSCSPCSAPAHASPTCSAGSCGFACNAGYVLVAGVCEVVPPRQIAPLSTATATTRRPTFEWALPVDATSARIEVCPDRDCSPSIGAIASGTGTTSWSPTSDLPTGVVFWRVRSSNGSTWSPTWELSIGARSAPVASSWGTIPDVDADGVADVLIGADFEGSAPGAVYLYRGRPTSLGGFDTAVAATLTTSRADAYFGSVGCAGDVDGDGFADVIVGAAGTNTFRGAAYIYHGSAAGLSTTPRETLTPDALTAPLPLMGLSVAGAGDVDHDGYADVIVGASDADALLFRGAPDGFSSAPTLLLSGAHSMAVASAGDVNGDRYADVLVAPHPNLNVAYVFLGGPGGVASSPSTTLASPDAGMAGFATDWDGPSVIDNLLSGGGDVNGDGYSDVVIAARRSGHVFVYLGSTGGLSATPSVTLTGTAGANVGDVNRDGYADVATQNVSTLALHFGGPSGIASTPSVTIAAPAPNVSIVARVGDVDGDRYGDFVIGAHRTGRAYLWRGAASGVTSPPLLPTAPAGSTTGFGFTIALAEPTQRSTALAWSSHVF